jgi:hypothetical protein
MEGYNGIKVDPQWWMKQARIGLQYRKVAAYEDRWNDWRSYYRGNWDDKIMPSNVFFKMIRTTVPRIYFRNPSVSITSRRGGMEGFIFSKLLERTDNKLIKTMRIKENLKRQIQNTWMFGTGVAKLGFGTLFHSTPEPGNFETEQPYIEQGRNKVEYDFTVQKNMPWYKSVKTSQYIIPGGTTYKEEARWECFMFSRSLDDVLADPRLKNTDKLKSVSHTKNFGYQISPGETSIELTRPVEMVDMYEFRDKKTGKVFILTPQLSEDCLFESDDGFLQLGIEVGHTLIFNDDDENFWGVPDSKILEPLQLEKNDIRTTMMYHRRLSLLKILARKNAISKDQIAKLLSEDIAAVAWVEGDPNTAIKTMEMANALPQGLKEMEMICDQDMRETVGFSRNEFGEYSQGREKPTATEVSRVNASSDIRVDERRDMVADLLVTVVNDSNRLIFRHWQKEQVEQIVGPAGLTFWVAFTPAMLGKHNYECNIDPDSAAAETKDARTEKALILYNILKTNPLVDPYKLTSYLLHELHGVAFDDMIAGAPPGTGMTPQNPMSVGQFGQVMTNIARRAPQLMAPQAQLRQGGGDVPTQGQRQGGGQR